MSHLNDIVSEDESDSYNPEENSQSTTTDSTSKSSLSLNFSEKDKQTSDQHKLQSNQQKHLIPSTVKLFLDLPSQTEEALRTFTNLVETTYQSKHIGEAETSSEFMSCQCHPDYDDPENELGNKACLDDDECINRGTKIECFAEGRNFCGVDCRNQRFSKKEYANISIIKTEKKGFGVRADQEMEPDTFIYEYIGEVIDEKTFKKRMVEYDLQGFKHFYFMMLQRGQFIDATVKGSLGRFLNHSCEPNCYVEKWVVGDKLKMGIFSKRQVKAGEELTFNYNVDRYGANSQPCYCGESNCIGVIGGKTQTESTGLLPQVYSEALLGFDDDSELKFVKEMQEQGKELVKNENGINVEYVKRLSMRQIEIYQVPKVSAALFQCEDLLILDKLILRVEKSKEEIIKKLYFTHGMESFKRLIKFYLRDSNDEWESLVIRILTILLNGPAMTKNYIEKSGIQEAIQDLVDQTSQYAAIHHKAVEVLERLATFEERHVIKKRAVAEGEEEVVRKPGFTSFHSRSGTQQQSYVAPSRSNTPQQQQQQQYNNSNQQVPQLDFTQLKQLEQMATGNLATNYNNGYSSNSGHNHSQVNEEEQEDGRVLLVTKDNHGLPKHWQVYVDHNQQSARYYFNTLTNQTQWNKPDQRQLHLERKAKLSAELSQIKAKEDLRKRYEEEQAQIKRDEEKRRKLEIMAKIEQEEKRRLELELQERQKEEERRKKKEHYKEKLRLKKLKEQAQQTKSQSSTPKTPSTVTPHSSSSGKEAHNKAWSHYFAKQITHIMKSYLTKLSPQHFKQHARELTKILTDKEYRRHPDVLTTPQDGTKDAKNRYLKVKGFVTEYLDKVVKRLEEKENSNKKREDESGETGDQDPKRQKTG